MLNALAFMGLEMKEIVALIRLGKAKVTKQKLAEQGFVAYTEKQVLGRGKQLGLHYLGVNEGEGPTPLGISFLPKCMLAIFVNDEDVDQAVRVIQDANKTGDIGDGKIFVCRAEDVVRIRTDERGDAPLSRTAEVSTSASV